MPKSVSSARTGPTLQPVRKLGLDGSKQRTEIEILDVGGIGLKRAEMLGEKVEGDDRREVQKVKKKKKVKKQGKVAKQTHKSNWNGIRICPKSQG